MCQVLLQRRNMALRRWAWMAPKNFCTFLATFRFQDLPEAAVHQARRGVLDWIGCALAGSQHKEFKGCGDMNSCHNGKQ
jgi:hypothetical protein